MSRDDPEWAKQRVREYDRLYRARNKEKESARTKAWYAQNKDKVRSRELNRSFGITIEEYRRMLEDQGGKCAICGATDSRSGYNANFAVDHCHKTKKVRALLCHPCNKELGIYEKHKEAMEAYVMKHRSIQ